MAPAPQNLVGERFGRLVVIAELPYRSATKNRTRKFKLQCDCGASTTSRMDVLKRGDKRSCGCLQRECAGDVLREGDYQLRHGDNRRSRRAPEHACWWAMIQRCEYQDNKHYSDYGGRGIKVCKRWRKSYENFLADMGRRPSPRHSIDRKDNDGHYTPKNCRWATASQQAKNRRRRSR